MMPRHYLSSDEDNRRWLEFRFRPGDIVISTRSKSGTTWMQMICALLVFRSPRFPAPLHQLSPWLDALVTPLDEVLDRLARQDHRRIVKTHTPLDGLPLDPVATFIVVARHPLDAAISLYHQGSNLDRARMAELSGNEPPADRVRPPIDRWLREWIAWEGSPAERLDSLPGFLHHAADAWARRDQPGVVLVHYEGLQRDLVGEMRRIAARLDIDADSELITRLAEHATFAAMKARSDEVAPNATGVLLDTDRFFRRGTSGSRHEVLTPTDLDTYRRRVASLGPPDLLEWLHGAG
jgi:hypothetical protein